MCHISVTREREGVRLLSKSLALFMWQLDTLTTKANNVMWSKSIHYTALNQLTCELIFLFRHFAGIGHNSCLGSQLNMKEWIL